MFFVDVAFVLVVITITVLAHLDGRRRGVVRGKIEAERVLESYLQNVRYSPSVRDCIQLVEGTVTMEALMRAERRERI